MPRDINAYTHMLWVHEPDKAFDNETGFVPCSREEFEKYKDSDIAQDPAHGANNLYETKVMEPKKKVVRKKKATKKAPDDNED